MNVVAVERNKILKEAEEKKQKNGQKKSNEITEETKIKSPNRTK